MPLGQIRKLNCDKCKLKTEHYLETDGERLIACRCLRCGHPRDSIESTTEAHESYPADTSRPIYVL